MGRIFNLDSPVMTALGKVADLMILNLLTFIACIPIITIGASLTAMHYVLLKMVRKEEGYIARSFFKSFRENFKHATVCWLIILLFLLIFIGDIQILNNSGIEFANGIRIALLAVGVIALMTITYVFPLLARFENTIRGTFKNALLMSILSLPKTVLMLVINSLPIAIIYLSLSTSGASGTSGMSSMLPIVFLFGISGPAFLCACLYSGTFKKFEPEVQDDNVGDNWTLPEEETITGTLPGEQSEHQD